MRSTTVGWLTSIVSVLPVIADHRWLNKARPEFRESTSQPIAPTQITPRNSPRISASTTAARDRFNFRVGGEDGGGDGGMPRGTAAGTSTGISGGSGIPQDYTRER